MSNNKTESSKNFKFKAEVNQLLDILTHSLYTHRDVFIRELVSNAADALDKVRFMEVKGDKVKDPDLPLEIKITLDKDKKIFTISDTGIGMTKEELVKNIGTIARSGTSDFLKLLSKEGKKDVNLIGKFGVGFYSVFMAGIMVEVTSQSANPQEPPYRWTSDGRGSFKVEPIKDKVQRGTTIQVTLRDDAAEFSEKFTIQSAIEKYSNFVPFPIYLDKEKINKISAIWREPKSSVTEKQYHEFFKFIAHQNEEALTWFHFSADVPIQFHALFFIPKTNLEFLGFHREESGINLFVKRVMIDSHAKEILPPYLRFVHGVLESDDLPLNISRETLQENPYVIKIKNTVVSKFLSYLKEFSEKEPEKYQEFWKQHGRILKEGYNDYTHKDQVAELFRYNSSKCKSDDEFIPLQTYIDRMHEKQEEIYFLSGPSREALEKNPKIEIFKSKNLEVLYSYDPIDEFALPGLATFKEKRFLSGDQVNPDKLKEIPTEEKKKQKTLTDEEEKGLDMLTRRIKDILGKKVESVKVSERLVDSPAVLVGKDQVMSSQMERIMQMMHQDTKVIPKILEINKTHHLILDMLRIYQNDAKDPLLSKLVNHLFYTVLLLDGTILDPNEMVSQMQDVLSETAKLYLRKGTKKQPKEKK